MGQRSSRTKGRASDIDTYVGTRLRLRRCLMGVTQEQLAKAQNVSFQQIQKYENGKNRISVGRLYGCAKTLECPLDYFFDGYEENYKKANQFEILDSDIPANFMKIWKKFLLIKKQKNRNSAIQAATIIMDTFIGVEK